MMRATGCLIVVLSATGAALAAPPAAELFATSDRCTACHNGVSAPAGEDISIGATWQGSMMANSSRDPYWQASVRRETMEHAAAAGAIEEIRANGGDLRLTELNEAVRADLLDCVDKAMRLNGKDKDKRGEPRSEKMEKLERFEKAERADRDKEEKEEPVAQPKP